MTRSDTNYSGIEIMKVFEARISRTCRPGKDHGIVEQKVLDPIYVGQKILNSSAAACISPSVLPKNSSPSI